MRVCTSPKSSFGVCHAHSWDMKRRLWTSVKMLKSCSLQSLHSLAHEWQRKDSPLECSSGLPSHRTASLWAPRSMSLQAPLRTATLYHRPRCRCKSILTLGRFLFVQPLEVSVATKDNWFGSASQPGQILKSRQGMIPQREQDLWCSDWWLYRRTTTDHKKFVLKRHSLWQKKPHFFPNNKLQFQNFIEVRHVTRCKQCPFPKCNLRYCCSRLKQVRLCVRKQMWQLLKSITAQILSSNKT